MRKLFEPRQSKRLQRHLQRGPGSKESLAGWSRGLGDSVCFADPVPCPPCLACSGSDSPSTHPRRGKSLLVPGPRLQPAEDASNFGGGASRPCLALIKICEFFRRLGAPSRRIGNGSRSWPGAEAVPGVSFSHASACGALDFRSRLRRMSKTARGAGDPAQYGDPIYGTALGRVLGLRGI